MFFVWVNRSAKSFGVHPSKDDFLNPVVQDSFFIAKFLHVLFKSSEGVEKIVGFAHIRSVLISPVKIRPRAGKTIVFQVSSSCLNRSTLAVDSYNTFETTVTAYIYDVAIFVRFVVALILVFHIRSV